MCILIRNNDVCVCAGQVPTFERIISASSTPTPPTQFISNRRCNRLPRMKQISFQHDPFRQHYAFTEILALDASALSQVPSRQRTERRGERVLFPCLPCVQTGAKTETSENTCRKMQRNEKDRKNRVCRDLASEVSALL